MKKRWKWPLLDLCTDERVELRVRLFRVILLLGEVACLLTTISNLLLNTGTVVTICSFLGCIFLGAAFFFTIRLRDCSNLLAIMVFLMNSLYFPLTFIYSGGIDSGAPVWLAFGLTMVFMLLEGWRFRLVLCTSILSIMIAYAAAFFRPEVIRPMSSPRLALYASCISLLMIGTLFGTIFYFQARMYRKAQQLAEEQRETIRQISDSRSLFFANMSHEIRTPINTIIGLNEMTLREDISDEVAENALNIQTASKILLALINDILDLSKIESGKMEIVPAQYETSALFSDLVNIIWIRAHEKNLDFNIDIDENIPSVLYGDEVRIKQVLVNLLTNAVKYTKKGSVSLTVRGEQLDANRIRLRMEVRDTGIGIKRENLENLFSSFRRVDEETNRGIEGTGLGLSISRQLVDMMGGTIAVDSIYTRGSVFTVTLEQQILNDRPLGSMQYAVRRSLKDRPRYNRSFEAPEAKVLVVDDNEMNRMVAKKLLRATRVQVDTASGGRECLQKTMEQFYHVIFMDHVMPEMDGEATLKALRSRAEGFCQDTPVIALTANVMSNAEEHYRGLGFDGYLSKPINGAVLEAALMRFLPPELIEYRAQEEDGAITDRITDMMIHGKKKKAVRITTDCVCDLPDDLLKKYDIHTMYYYLTTEEGRFRDLSELVSDNLLEYMNHGHRAESGPASIREYEAFFGDNLAEAEQVIHISMSYRVSQGFEMAARAACCFDNVLVLDSGHLSSGLGLIVLEAARAAQEGADADAIHDLVEHLKNRISTSFIVASPDNLYLSGRIPGWMYRLTHNLQLHPVLRLANGKLRSAQIYAGRMDSAARSYIRRRLRPRRRIDDRLLFVTYAGCSIAQLEEIREEIDRCMKFKEIRFQKATSAVASNCGIGAFGLIYMRKR